MRYILAFSYIVETSKTSNGTPFKQGDTLSIQGTKAFADGGWHDKDKTGRPYRRFGLAIWKNERPVTESFVEAISMILFEDKPTKVGG